MMEWQISDQDIQTAEELLLPHGAHFPEDARNVIRCWHSTDVAACPGSGKTTVLLAKLKILADRMPLENGAGICVLSHTNVAVDEIKNRLSNYADRLLSYPNYIGTIQSFIDRFVTMPYLRNISGQNVQVVDNLTYAQHVLSMMQHNARYNTLNYVTKNRTRIQDADGKRVPLYAKTPEELYEKVREAKQQIEEAKFRRATPSVAEYCERWLLMQSANIRVTTLNDYRSKVKNYIIAPLGHMYMADVTADDMKLALVPVSQKSASGYRSVHALYKAIFNSAVDSNIIDYSPCEKISGKGGKPQKNKESLSDEQIEKLLDAIKGLPPYVFVMIGLYAGLRREEILGLKWDCVFLDSKAPYLSVRRAWHSEHNRPVITDELKTKAARRDIPLPPQLVECLREAKAKSTSDFVVANSEGDPLSYTQFKRVWQYIVTRSTKERTYTRYINGEKIVHTVTPVLGQAAAHNGNVVYSLDFQVTPHQLRHTYITNLIYAAVDPKTVQYLAGHENSKITMDIYAKVKYNKPEQLASVVNSAFS